jgi:uncharacterized protein
MPTVEQLENPPTRDHRASARLGAVLITGLTAALDLYHVLVAPFLAAHSGSACRFEPSCSRYAKIALDRYGIWRGGYLAIRRLARCNPLGGHGYDPVPQPPTLSS